jgi:hypothetical protein
MNNMLQEFCDSRGVTMRVDRPSGVIRGVKVLGFESRNGRTYLPEALQQAARLYEEAKVNVNHPKGSPTGPRDYQDRIGTIRNVTVRPEEGMFGDFHFNPKHALAEQLLWDAEHAPENVGFSHNVEARVARRGDRVVVEAITRVQSVDLVADPATTSGLFESASSDAPVESAASTNDAKNADGCEAVERLCREQADEIVRLRREVERLAVAESDARKRAAMRRLLREFALPDPESDDPRTKAVVGQPFIESLLAAADESAMRTLVEERARLVHTLAGAARDAADSRPRSRDQHVVYAGAPMSVKSFLEAIT